ncbi:MAG TPA: polysaccharide biosynthesis tyrosine autokinase, partial [Chthonomonadales bacterium]|nr:polysaccharide biosynthesis tyrosine autokinase [Chthonomonadales bacterium]
QQYTDNFPGKVPQMKQQIASLKKQIKDAVYSAVDLQVPSLPTQATLLENYKQQQVVVSYDRAKLTASQNGLNAVHALEAGIPPMALLDSRLKREVDMDTALYQSLATAATSATTDIDRADGNVEIIQGARVPEKPFSPDFVKNTLVGILLALLLGVGCSLVMDQSDNRIREIGDIKRLVAAPIIGMLPKLSRSERKALARGESPARVIEAAGFANAGLERALSRAEPDRIGEPDVILVTSTVPGEGKSTTAAELAKSIARTGKRVTLVDADMTRPAQNRLFNTAEPTGLADVLEGRMSVADALVDSDIENLSILHGGQLTRNPMHLVSSPRMREALGALRAEADVVIIDTPASAVVADALHIARFADCVVYVIGLGKPDAGVVHDAVTALNDAGPHVAFFVNRVSQKQRRSFRSYYVVRTPGRRSGLGGRQDDEKLLASAAQDQSSGYGDEEVV